MTTASYPGVSIEQMPASVCTITCAATLIGVFLGTAGQGTTAYDPRELDVSRNGFGNRVASNALRTFTSGDE
jgi:hypothetical protein